MSVEIKTNVDMGWQKHRFPKDFQKDGVKYTRVHTVNDPDTGVINEAHYQGDNGTALHVVHKIGSL